jgi:hypothetical protein
MLGKRLAVLFAGAALASGGAVAAATGAFAGGGDDSHRSATSTARAPTPVHLDVPGVGTIAFTLQPDGTATDIVITPAAGVTVGTPTPNDEGFTVPVTAPDGTTRVVKVKAKPDDEGVEVEVEAQDEQPNGENENHNGDHQDGEHQNGDHQNGEHGGPDVGTTPAPPGTAEPDEHSGPGDAGGDHGDRAPAPAGGDHSGGDDHGGGGGGHSGGDDHSGGGHGGD